MRILVLGATGGTGQRIVDQTLRAGHNLTAHVRNPGKMHQPDPRLRIVNGHQNEADRLEAILKDCDVVMSALGHSHLFDATPIVATTIRGVLRAMQKHGVCRLIYESAYRAGAQSGEVGFLFERILIPLLLRRVFDDHTESESAISKSRVEWVIARPGALTDGTAHKRVSHSGAVRKGTSLHFARRHGTLHGPATHFQCVDGKNARTRVLNPIIRQKYLPGRP